MTTARTTHYGSLVALDRRNGKTVTPVVSSACIAGRMVFIGSNDGKVYAFFGRSCQN